MEWAYRNHMQENITKIEIGFTFKIIPLSLQAKSQQSIILFAPIT